MAAQACHGLADDAPRMPSCHGSVGDGDDPGASESTCPASQVTPDVVAKLPPIAALPFGHDFVVDLGDTTSGSELSRAPAGNAREGPNLAALCRLLI